MGRYELALAKLLEAEKQLDRSRTPDAVVYDHIADTHRKIGNYRMAIDYWRKSLEVEKNGRIELKIKEAEKYLREKD
jgi:hypothetical protein